MCGVRLSVVESLWPDEFQFSFPVLHRFDLTIQSRRARASPIALSCVMLPSQHVAALAPPSGPLYASSSLSPDPTQPTDEHRLANRPPISPPISLPSSSTAPHQPSHQPTDLPPALPSASLHVQRPPISPPISSWTFHQPSHQPPFKFNGPPSALPSARGPP